MSKTTLQLRRGSTADNAAFTGALGEVVVDTTRKTLVVHDGVTVGGSALATLASPALSGTPTAPTATTGSNTTQIATTQFVTAAIAGFSAAATNTDAVAEGTTNLYFTKDRVFNSLTAGGNISITENPTTKQTTISYSQPTNVSTFTNDAGYLTTASIKTQVSAAGSITYDSGTGIFTYNEAVHSVNGQTGNIVLNADNIAGGTTNKYATTANVQTALAGGGISNTMLANPSATINGTTVTLGGSATVAAAASTLTGTILNATVVTSSLTSVGTLNQLAISVGTGSLSNAGALTIGTQNFNDINILASFVSNQNNYNQITTQNLNAGTAASANFIAYNNAGSSSANYALLGINSTGYNSNAFGLGALNTAGYGIVVSGSTDLAVGTYGNSSIHFQVAATTSASDQMTIQGTSGATFGFVGINNASPAYRLDVNGDVNFTGKMRVSGNAGVAGQVLQSQGTSASPTWTSISASLPNITELDSFGAKINGGTYAFTPTNNGNAVSISIPAQVLMHKNGQYLKGWLNNSRPVWNTINKFGDYTVNSSGQIVFYSPPQVGDVISATVLVGNTANPIVSNYPFAAFDIMTGT